MKQILENKKNKKIYSLLFYYKKIKIFEEKISNKEIFLKYK
jgi:hypothetical protein